MWDFRRRGAFFPKPCLHWGVLTVLLKRGLWFLTGSGRAAAELKPCKLQYKRDVTFKNPSVFKEFNSTFADFLDFSILFQHFPLRFPFGRSWAPWHQITSRLRPDCVQITSRLLPDYFQIASYDTSRLLPDWIASRLLPDYSFQITSIRVSQPIRVSWESTVGY